MRIRRVGLAACAVMLQLSACATIRAPAPINAPAPEFAMIQLKNREQSLTSLQSVAVMEYSGPNGRVKARERITVRRPADLRVEALSPVGVALVVTANAHEIAVFDPSRNTIARGAATATTLDRVAQIPLDPNQAVRLLLALPPEPVKDTVPAPAIADAAGVKRFTFDTGNGNGGELSIGADGNLAMVRVSASDQTIEYEIHYADYHDIGAMSFPYTLEANFPGAATSIKLRYEMPTIDGAVPDSAFTLPTGPGIKEISLE